MGPTPQASASDRVAAKPPGHLHGRPVCVVGAIGALAAVCLIPPVFSVAFAVGSLVGEARKGLWIGAAALGLLSGCMLWRRSRVRASWAALLAGLLLLMTVELATRLGVRFAPPALRKEIAWLGLRTYPRFMALQGHPFLQYVGTESRGNSFGFPDKDFRYEKPEDTVRVVCLGGSTTESPYPAFLEMLLNSRRRPGEDWFEVYNLGKQGYTSLHVLVNFVINGIEFNPDYAVVHSGSNDALIRDRERPVRRDYAELLKPFELPTIPDKWLWRTSVIYRLAQRAWGGQPAWADQRNALEYDFDVSRVGPFDNLEELLPYRRNIEKILDLAAARSIVVVLTTMPYNTDPRVPLTQEGKHMGQCNDVIRELARTRRDGTVLVDLDPLLTGKNQHFIDHVHVTRYGHQLKADRIAAAVLSDYRTRRARGPASPRSP